MTPATRALGVACLCAAGWLTLAAILVDKAGSSLYHLGSDHD